MGKGYIHVYTGNGKGKTTASMGLVLRALGAGHRVGFCQFVKNGEYSEIRTLNQLKEDLFPNQLTIEQFGIPRKVMSPFTGEDKKAAQKGLEQVNQWFLNNCFDLLVLDEINIAVNSELLTIDSVLSLIEKKPAGLELILTGRYAKEEILKTADLVTEMTLKKHYADQGIPARKGIEF